jgi:hypothetical protein
MTNIITRITTTTPVTTMQMMHFSWGVEKERDSYTMSYFMVSLKREKMPSAKIQGGGAHTNPRGSTP